MILLTKQHKWPLFLYLLQMVLLLPPGVVHKLISNLYHIKYVKIFHSLFHFFLLLILIPSSRLRGAGGRKCPKSLGILFFRRWNRSLQATQKEKICTDQNRIHLLYQNALRCKCAVSIIRSMHWATRLQNNLGNNWCLHGVLKPPSLSSMSLAFCPHLALCRWGGLFIGAAIR